MEALCTSGLVSARVTWCTYLVHVRTHPRKTRTTRNTRAYTKPTTAVGNLLAFCLVVGGMGHEGLKKRAEEERVAAHDHGHVPSFGLRAIKAPLLRCARPCVKRAEARLRKAASRRLPSDKRWAMAWWQA